MVAYIPGQGDIVALTFDPQSGHIQKRVLAGPEFGLLKGNSRSARWVPF